MLLIPELERQRLQVPDCSTLGMVGTLQVLPAKPFPGAIGTERKVSLHSVDKSNFQFLKLIVVINTAGSRFM